VLVCGHVGRHHVYRHCGADVRVNLFQVIHPWAGEAACKGMDPDIFFPERGDHDGVRVAKAVCLTCPVKTDCRDAHINEREGIWGGMSSRERRVYRGKHRERTCAMCGNVFTLEVGGQKYCRGTCSETAKKQRRAEERRRRASKSK